MRRAIARLLLRSSDHAALHGRSGAARLAASVPALQALHAQVFEPDRPSTSTRRRASTQCVFDLAVGFAVGQRQDQARTKDVSGGQAARLRLTLQLLSLLGRDDKQSLIIGHIIKTRRLNCRYHWDGPIVWEIRVDSVLKLDRAAKTEADENQQEVRHFPGNVARFGSVILIDA